MYQASGPDWRGAGAVKPGGTLVIAERFPDPERRTAVPALLFALNMLLHTTDGTTWTIPEFTDWLSAAGFTNVRTMPSPGPDPLLIATRA